MRAGRIDHFRQRRDGLFERRVAVDGVLPDLVGVGTQVHLAVRVVVEDAGLLGEQVADRLLVVVVFEEVFVGADDFGILLQALADSGPQPEDSFNAVGRQEGIAENGLRLLADTVHAAGTLHKPNDGPRQIVIHHDGGVLEVLAFAEHVGGDDDAKFLVRGHLLPLVVALGAETPRIAGRVVGVARHAGQLGDPGTAELPFKVVRRVGKLREDQHLLVGMRLASTIPRASSAWHRGRVPSRRTS